MGEKRKNVLLICTDHWPGYLLGCAGHPVVMTPTLDQLAVDGIRFDRCYSTCPVCIPARRSLMTGTFPATHGDRVYSEKMTMPEVKTLAQAFRDAGYQAYAVGKLHVYPQRNRIGFDDVILEEEGRTEFGVTDDYEIWLGENGCVGQEFAHSMGNNCYYTRPWHLPERMHPTAWATREMIRQIRRKDPTRPAFYYLSYSFPHPPLVPIKDYLELYDLEEIDAPQMADDWDDNRVIWKFLKEKSKSYSKKEIYLARRAFYAQCTYIDHQIRSVIGTLKEEGLLKNTVIVFFSDHGDTLFDHGLAGKRTFYEGAANVPMIFSGEAVGKYRGTVDSRVTCLEDVMPTLLTLCGISVPDTVEGMSMFSEKKRKLLYGEIGEDIRATRMVTDGKRKLIYYPCGNVFQFFDLEKDPKEQHDLHEVFEWKDTEKMMIEYLIAHLHGKDCEWMKDGKLVGFPEPEYYASPDYTLFNQRGIHWPPPGQGQ
ncbi:arylsulfatase [Lachnoclostridium sp. An169]|uniref:sulfatase-like hydrolase/transferase n=1 Tax=Lachnoclostridium sp. An169 TaxID=1965569 RepID=UPI000B3B08AF|nr:sulfatase-like hydrolase/transferase [Lachnoclostridium sp. An169]OUP86485.1 arylsulfatase [Lachnoclostridium sp. An169]HJA64994.1 sulfatase-like hydrolase/transferase [Candidatus Mediterraneibacter cottocaccae]